MKAKLLLCMVAAFFPAGALAADPPPASSATPAAAATPAASSAASGTAQKAPGGAQKIEVDALKQKYWAKGDSRELEVVQNRVYTKQYKLNVEFDFGSIHNDPFLDTLTYGGQLGFYFSEYLGVDFFYFLAKSSHNAAYNAFVDKTGNGANSNALNSFMGGEINASILYGKLSLLGKAILHFDLIVRGGAGLINVDNNGNLLAPFFGVGQQLFITRWLVFHVDWRMMIFSAKVVEQFQPDTKGNVLATNTNYANMVTGGLSFLLF